MLLFHELVADDYVPPDGIARFAKRHWDPVLGNLEQLRIMVVADRVSGSGPLLSMNVFESPDLSDAVLNAFAFPFVNAPLTVGQANVLTASLTPSTVASYSYTFSYVLTGTTPRAHIRIWVSGRGTP